MLLSLLKTCAYLIFGSTVTAFHKTERKNTIKSVTCITSTKMQKITIIAAAGDNPDYGLPGITVNKIFDFSHAFVDGQIFFAFRAGRDPTRLIAASKWASRGWTYQEAFFQDENLFSQTHASISSATTRPMQWVLIIL